MKVYLFILFQIISFNVLAVDPIENYSGTEVKTYAELNNLFTSLNKRSKRNSQCYERAHVWSYELFDSKNIFSYKAFIFFTRKYITNFDKNWWFHVAPSIKLNSDFYVFDPEFLTKPVPLNAWKNGAIDKAVRYLSNLKIKNNIEIEKLTKELVNLNVDIDRNQNRIDYIKSRLTWIDNEEQRLLIKDSKLVVVTEKNWPFQDNLKEILDIDCPIITKYSEYKTAQEAKYCYIIMSNMYVWEPSELHSLENQGQNKQEFMMGEIFTSFKRGFKGRYPF